MIKPFGIILIGLILYNVFYKKKLVLNNVFEYLLSLLIFLELFINVGYMFKILDYELFYSEFVLVLLFLITIVIMLKNTNSFKIKWTLILFTFSLMATEMYLMIKPIDKSIFRNGIYLIPEFSVYSLLIMLRVVMMLIISVVAINLIKSKELNEIVNRIAKNTMYIYILCTVEWVIKNVFHSQIFNTVIDYIFGKGIYSVDFLLERGSLYSLQGLLREPAHLSFGLFMFLMIILLSNLNSKAKNKYFIIGSGLILISGSLSGIGYIFALILCRVVNIRKKIKPIIFGALLICIAAFLTPAELTDYYISRITNSWMILSSSSEALLFTSEQVRLFSITETFKTVFLERPILGAGLGIPYAYGANIMILASIGIIGFILWVWYYFISIGDVIRKNKVFVISIMFIVFTFIGSINVIYSAYILLLALEIKLSNSKLIQKYS